MKKILYIAIAALAFTQCNTDQLQNLNINPQAVNQIDMNFLFSASLVGIASNGSSGDNRYTDWRTNIGMCAYAMQHLGNVGGGIAPGDKYTDNGETVAAPFDFTYADQLKNITEVLKQTGKGGYDEGHKVNMRNAARIVRALAYHRLVDFYGNVPYTEANKGTDGLFFPKYDDGKAIYTDLLKELDEACATLSASNPDEGFKQADFIYKGDVAKWKKFGYSLMLRLAMRASDADAGLAGTYVSKAIAGGVMTDNSDNFVVPQATGPSQWTNQNGISRAFYPGDGGQPAFLGRTLIDFLKGKDKATVADDDPRLMIISGGIADWKSASYTVINGNPLDQKGMPNGYDQTGLNALEGKTVDLDATYSKINFKMMQLDEPYMLMNVGEVELLLANAKLKGIGNVSGTDKQHYEAGVKAAMQMYTVYDPSLTVSDAAVTAYLTTYPYGTYKPAIEMIGEQLWVSKFLNWYDAWSDWRRLDFPKLVPTNHPSTVTGGVIPVRLRYPTSEVAANPNLATTGTKPDNYLTKVWWDKN